MSYLKLELIIYIYIYIYTYIYISSVGPVVSVVSIQWSPSSSSVRPVRPVVHPVVVVRPLSVRPVVSRRRPVSVRPSRRRRQGPARGPYEVGFLLTRVCAIVLRLLYGLG